MLFWASAGTAATIKENVNAEIVAQQTRRLVMLVFTVILLPAQARGTER
jgi:hypothetical protein